MTKPTCGIRFQTDVAMNFACGKPKGHEDHGDYFHGRIDQQVLSDARDVTAGRKIAVIAGETTSASLDRLIEEMRTIGMVAGQCSVEGREDTKSQMAAAEAERALRWADALAALRQSSAPPTKAEKL